MLVWVGNAPGDYNEAIAWIQERIDDPDYVMTQPEQYVAPARLVDDYEDEWDDVPF